MLIIEELGENVKFLSQKLIGEIHCSVHDSCSMGSYGIGNMADVDGIEVLVV